MREAVSDHTKWNKIDAPRAVRSVKAGAKVWKLQKPFYSGGSTYTHGLQTNRGTRYVISNWVMSSVEAALKEMAKLALEMPGVPTQQTDLSLLTP